MIFRVGDHIQTKKEYLFPAEHRHGQVVDILGIHRMLISWDNRPYSHALKETLQSEDFIDFIIVEIIDE